MTQLQGNEPEQLKQLVGKWVAALLDGDVDLLTQMTADVFITIGPRGFVLSKEQWLEGIRLGTLEYQALT